MRRKGLGKGTKGYKNILGNDSKIHSQSARGIKQPMSMNESRLNSIDRNIKEQCPICKEWLYSDETHYVCESNEELSKDKFFLEEQKKEELKKEYKELLNRDIDDLSINIENRRIKNRMNEIEEIFRKEDIKLNKQKFEKINIISNLNTINLKDFKKDKPLSFAFLSLQKHLDNSGMELELINQDENRVYFKIHNKINKYTTSITELSNEELLKMDIHIAQGLKDEVWNKTI